jgi:hypothetical protein
MCRQFGRHMKSAGSGFRGRCRLASLGAMGGALMVMGLFGSLIVWLVAIRPYALRHGQGFTPGASVGITAWVDWEQAKSIAKARGDRGMRRICQLFFCLNAAVVVGFLSLFFVGR